MNANRSEVALTVGVIGAGNIGGTLAVSWAQAGHHVRLANSRGPHSLRDLVANTTVEACDLHTVAHGADVVVISVPFYAVAGLRSVVTDLPADVTVVDTSNYVHGVRDTPIPEIDNGEVETVWVGAALGRPMVKAFNTINAASLHRHTRAVDTARRIAIPIAADRPADRHRASVLVVAAGFDPVDAGSVAQSWRQQPGTPVYTTNLDAHATREALAAARPEQTVAWRAAMAATV